MAPPTAESLIANAPEASLARALRLLQQAGATGALIAVATDAGLRCRAQLGLSAAEQAACLARGALALAGGEGAAPPPDCALLRNQAGAAAGVLCALAPAGAVSPGVLDEAGAMLMAELELRAPGGAQAPPEPGQLFHSNPAPMWIYDLESLRFLEVNAAAVSVYGWSRADFLAMTILDIRPQEERAAVARAAAAQVAGRRTSGPWRHFIATGETRMVQIMSSPILYLGRRAMLAASFDVTEQLRATAAMRRSEAALQVTAGELAEAMQLAQMGTWRRRLDRQEAEWSDEVFTIFGCTRADFIPTPASVAARLHPEDRASFREMLERIAAGEAPPKLEFRVVRADGSIRHCWTRGRLQTDPEGGPPWLCGFCQDVTERRQAEQALSRAEKLSTIGQMTGGIAHDFNNLLTVIALSLEMAEDMAQGEPRLLSLLQAARGAADKGAQLTAQLLSYARRQPLRPVALSAGGFVAELQAMLPRVLGERHTAQVVLAPETPRFTADPAQLETAVLNLVLNARDAMPEGGPVRLELEPVTFSEHYAAGRDELQPGRYVMIAVTDRGTGMSPETLRRVFEPFFTTKPVGQGTGLGLSMVLGFAKQSGGHVSIYSEPGQGTVVKIYLPVADAPAAAAAPIVAAGRLPPLAVLVVEDKDDVRAAACRLCEALGLVPTPAASAEAALALLESGAQFGLLFTDVVLGGAMDGAQLAMQARKLVPDLPVLLTSGYTELGLEQGQADRLDPAIRLLSKPYTRSNFSTAVRAVLERPPA